SSSCVMPPTQFQVWVRSWCALKRPASILLTLWRRAADIRVPLSLHLSLDANSAALASAMASASWATHNGVPSPTSSLRAQTYYGLCLRVGARRRARHSRLISSPLTWHIGRLD